MAFKTHITALIINSSIVMFWRPVLVSNGESSRALLLLSCDSRMLWCLASDKTLRDWERVRDKNIRQTTESNRVFIWGSIKWYDRTSHTQHIYTTLDYNSIIRSVIFAEEKTDSLLFLQFSLFLSVLYIIWLFLNFLYWFNSNTIWWLVFSR